MDTTASHARSRSSARRILIAFVLGGSALLVLACACGGGAYLLASQRPEVATNEYQESCRTIAAGIPARVAPFGEVIAQRGEPDPFVGAVFGFASFRRGCMPAGSGAWWLRLDGIESRQVPDEGAFVVGRWALAFVDHAGRVFDARREALRRGEADDSFSWPQSSELPVSLFEEPVIYDWDGDGSAEIALGWGEEEWESHPVLVHSIFTFRDGSVVPFAATSQIAFERVLDYDHDGRPDLVGATGTPIETDSCGMEGSSGRGPLQLWHALAGGTFSATDATAVRYMQEQCPAVDAPLVPRIPEGIPDAEATVVAVACARMRGTSMQEIESRLQREWPQNITGELAECVSLTPVALVEWAGSYEAPLRLP